LRNLAIVGALVTLSTGGAVVLSSSAFSDPANGQKLTICHATRSNTNPYREISPNVNATGLHGGHITHTGPIWDPTIKGNGGSWGDIIPPFDYTDGNNVVQHFDGLNWTGEGQQILANGCDIPNSVTPDNPTLTQASCNSDHNLVAPTLTFQDTAHVTYTVAPAAPFHGGETVVVTATADAPAFWFLPSVPGDWVIDPDNPAVATLSITFDDSPTCTTPATPVAPTVTQAACVGDPAQLAAPTVTFGAAPAGVTYSVSSPAPYHGGQSITVRATADATHTFTSPGVNGWTFQDAHHETYAITFHAAPDCGGAAPGGGTPPPLANTGVNSTQLGELGGIVLLFGFGLQFLSMGMRRRPNA